MNGREIPAGWFLERFDKILEEDAPFDVSGSDAGD